MTRRSIAGRWFDRHGHGDGFATFEPFVEGPGRFTARSIPRQPFSVWSPRKRWRGKRRLPFPHLSGALFDRRLERECRVFGARKLSPDTTLWRHIMRVEDTITARHRRRL